MSVQLQNYPLVSVVVPCYNHARFVHQTLLSIANQTYPNIQLIVIDDSSSDSSAEVISEFAKTHSADVVLRKSNGGLISSLNEGIALAQGKYIAFVASDDYWAPQKIALQIAAMEADDQMRMVFTEGMDVDSTGNVLGPIKYSKRQIEKWKFDDVLMKADLPPASLMARTAEILAVGGFSTKFKIEDFPMWLLLLKDGGYASVLREPLVFYRSHEENMHNVFSTMVLDQHYAVVEYFSRDHPNRKKVLAEWNLRNANFLARTNKSESARYLLRSGLRMFDYRFYACLLRYLLC